MTAIRLAHPWPQTSIQHRPPLSQTTVRRLGRPQALRHAVARATSTAKPALKAAPKPPVANPDIAVVTGASRGIGHAAARGMLERGYALVAVTKDAAAQQALHADLRADFPHAAIDVHHADLSKMRHVRRLAEDLKAQYPRIDVLINNAGRIRTERRITDEGNDEMLAVNALAPWLLSRDLMPALCSAARPRIVQVSSDGHRGFWFEKTRLDLHDLQGDREAEGVEAVRRALIAGAIPVYEPLRRYFHTKLVGLMLSYELARRVGDDVTINNIHPGLVQTALGRDFPKLGDWMHNLRAITPAQSAASIVELSDNPRFATVNGAYFDRNRRSRSSAASYNRTQAGALWDRCEALLPAQK